MLYVQKEDPISNAFTSHINETDIEIAHQRCTKTLNGVFNHKSYLNTLKTFRIVLCK